ncbi:MAG: hypothetical protein MUE69_25590 [Myxococcota bacterium]|jgi:alpha-tubulin suppressor-like RCC1 family protein|nr:hypothetical protein [Myxococcota bacterium]
MYVNRLSLILVSTLFAFACGDDSTGDLRDATPPADGGDFDAGPTREDAGEDAGSVDEDAGGADEDAGSVDDDGGVDAGPIDETPPALTTSAPWQSSSRVARVSGVATDESGAPSVSATIDGETLPVTLADDGAFELVVPLAPGENTLVVETTDAAGNVADETLSVYFGHRVSIGNSQAAFLREGTLHTWGRNELGQLGNGTLIGSRWGDDPADTRPVRYAVDLEGVLSVVTRQTFMVALRDDGSVWTWGSNGDGQLGYATASDCGSAGTSACSRTPTAVPGITNAIAVQAGFTHTLVLRDDGTVWTFGNNGSGQLGHSTGVASTPTPTQVPGLDDVVQIAAGSAVSYLLRANGEVYAFGANDQGQLGLGAADSSPHVTPMRVPSVSNAIAVAAANTTAYALLADGTVLAWGRNHAGQGGVASEATTVLAPTPVLRLAADGSASALGGVVGVAGDGFVGAALHSDGSVLAWGLGSLGQLGQGVLPDGARDLENRRAASPVAVSDADRALFVIQEIEVGAGGPTLALSRDGNLFGWGWSFQGSLGLEGAINAWAYSSPVLVMAAP